VIIDDLKAIGAVDRGQPMAADLISPLDQRLHEILLRSSIRQSTGLNDRPNILIRKSHDDSRGPVRIIGPHIVEGGVRVFRLPFFRIEMIGLKAADTAEVWIFNFGPVGLPDAESDQPPE
jgi:hypothetical protein